MTGVVGHEGSRGDELVVGVDTHQDEHVAVVIDRQGVRLGELHTVATIKGYGKLERWSRGLAGADGAWERFMPSGLKAPVPTVPESPAS